MSVSEIEIESPFVVKASANQAVAFVTLALLMSPVLAGCLAFANVHEALNISGNTLLGGSVGVTTLVALVFAVRDWMRNRRKYAVVDAHGIAIFNGELLLQHTRWSDLTFVKRGWRWQLVDPDRRPLDLSYLNHSAESERLYNILFAIKEASIPDQASSRRKVMAYLVIISLVTFALAEVVQVALLKDVDPDESTLSQVWTQAGVTTLQVMAALSVSMLVMVVIDKWARRLSSLPGGVDRQQLKWDESGWLIEVEWKDGVELHYASKTLKTAYAVYHVIFGVSVMITIFSAWKILTGDSKDQPGALAIAFAPMAFLGSLSLFGIQSAKHLERGLWNRYRRMGDYVQVSTPDGRQWLAKPNRWPQKRHRRDSSFGAFTIRLKARGFPTVLIDPRFLVPVDQERS